MIAWLWTTVAQAQTGILYLTFDDGPLEGTEEIQQILTEEAIPGTFFMVGQHVMDQPPRQELLARLRKKNVIFLIL